MLDGGNNFGDGSERAVELANVLDEGLDVANGDFAGNDVKSAENADGNIAEVGNDVGDGESEARKELRFPGLFIESLVDFGKCFDGSFDVGVGFDDELTGIIFFDDAVEFAESFAFGGEIFLGFFRDFAGEKERKRDGDEGDGGE